MTQGILTLLAALSMACGAEKDEVAGGDGGSMDAASSYDAMEAQTDLPTALVETRKGPVQGERVGDLSIFRGIPYAASPERWRPPKNPEPWLEVRDATSFGFACQQPPSEFLVGFVPPPQDQDCLNLNVWTPATDVEEKLPVMVSIHGGGFTLGGGAVEVFEGSKLATHGNVVVVTLNYRLGPLGFLAHPSLTQEGGGTSGNYGLLDQIQALEWVRDNVEQFGGDPNNVTILGESAGGGSVCYMMASPMASGLFHRGIVQSFNCFGRVQLLDEDSEVPAAHALGETVAENLGCDTADDVLACMRGVTFDELVIAGNVAASTFSDGEQFWPIIDGVVLPEHLNELVAEGSYNPAPLIIGSTANEAALFRSSYAGVNTVLNYQIALSLLFGDDAAEVLTAYPAATPVQAFFQYERVLSDYIFRCPARRVARAFADHQDVWLYNFTMVHPSADAQAMGSYHGTDVFYTYGNLELASVPPEALGSEDYAMTDAMMDYWTSFARSGSPTGPVAWPSYALATDAHLTLGTPIETGTGLLREQCDMFDSF